MSVSEPGKITVPWATGGLKNAIPANANPTTGNAGYDQGFPPVNMTPKVAGGIPPFGQDFNGILFEITTILRYMQAGGLPTYSSSLSTAIGGYSKGAVVIGSDGLTLFHSQVDNNTNDPNTNPTGWLPTISNPYPVGAPIPWPTAVPPAGFLVLNGQSFNTTTYPKLAAAYPSGVLPDARAQVVRGWDNGRGIDVGRSLLSEQGDAIRNITAQLFMRPSSGNAGVGTITAGAGAFGNVVIGGGNPGVSSMSTGANATSDVIAFNASNVVPTASENRVRNISFNYIVRAA
jgi:hypothetical protein